MTTVVCFPLRPIASIALLVAAGLSSGCSAFTHYADSPDALHHYIRWRTDFAVAQAEVRATDKPMLAILVAGARVGEC